MPRDGHIFHAEFCSGSLLVFTVPSAHIDDYRYSHLLQGFESVGAGLASAIEVWSDFREVRQTYRVLTAAHGMASGGSVVLRGLRESGGYREEERGIENGMNGLGDHLTVT